MDKRPPPPPPPMRETRGPFGVETEQSKARTAEWQRQHDERVGKRPPTCEWRHKGQAMPSGWEPGDPVPGEGAGTSMATWFKRFHLAATIFWIAMVYPTVVYWKSSIEYLVFISIYAVIIGHITAWQTSRVERKEEKREEAQDGQPTQTD